MDPLYRDYNGYYLLEKIEGSEPFSYPEYKINKINNNSNTLILNTGGTISSFAGNRINGLECKDIYEKQEFLKEFISKNKVDYECHNLKFSEFYDYEDYLDLRKKLNSDGHKRYIIFHGTDNLNYFSTWIKLLSIEFKFKAIVIATQRSQDRPNYELPLLLESAYKLLLSMKNNNTYVLSYKDANTRILHDPYELKKMHTYARDAFFSKNMQVLQDNKTTFKEQKKPKGYKSLASTNNIFNFEIASPFNYSINSNLVLGSGLGNFNYRSKKLNTNDIKNRITKTLVPLGSENYSIYDNTKNDKEFSSQIASILGYTFEAISVIVNLSVFNYIFSKIINNRIVH